MVFTAAVGVLLLLGLGGGRDRERPPDDAPQLQGLTHHSVLRVVAKLLLPLILLFGLYVQFHGDYGPGGGVSSRG